LGERRISLYQKGIMRRALWSLIACATAALTVPAHAGLFNLVGSFSASGTTAPSNMTIDAQGNFYITDFAQGVNNIKVYDAAHSPAGVLGTGTFVSPAGIVAAPNGMLYVGDITHIVPMSTSGVAGIPFGTFSGGIYSITADAASNLFIAEVPGSTVRFYSPSGVLGTTITSADGLTLKFPSGIAIDSSHLYVSDTFNNRIILFDLAGNFQSAFPAFSGDHPGPIAVHNGIIYAGFKTNIVAYSSTGQTLDTYAGGGGPMAFSGDTLYVLDQASHQIFAFQAPEPASLSVMMGGILLFRRGRRRWQIPPLASRASEN